jgi:5S rRNA maturation endonuclease (ribonuclease M5)
MEAAAIPIRFWQRRSVKKSFLLTLIGRGYASLDARYKLVERFRASGKERLVLLILSDFDPDGEEIAHSFARSLRDDFGLNENDIEPIRVALTTAQIREFELVPVMAAKESSANYDRFVDRYADTVVHELDALTPAQLQEILTNAINDVIDVEAFNAEVDREKKDSVWLDGVRRTVHETLQSRSLEE